VRGAELEAHVGGEDDKRVQNVGVEAGRKERAWKT